MSQVLKYAILQNFVAMEGYFKRILYWHVLLLKCDFTVISQERIFLEYNIYNRNSPGRRVLFYILSTTQPLNYGFVHK